MDVGVVFVFVSDVAAEATEVELLREADAAIIEVGVTEVEVIIDAKETAAGTATFGAEIEVEDVTDAVAMVAVEAETAVLEVWVGILVEGTDSEAETAMFEEAIEVARSLA